ncbi:hypothetical protein K1719_007184 [Acacia pycnantha]|nr:hypothetical protein K1719_007184 [Acacia pycnantha]
MPVDGKKNVIYNFREGETIILEAIDVLGEKNTETITHVTLLRFLSLPDYRFFKCYQAAEYFSIELQLMAEYWLKLD